jgi:hypothetical protein
VKYVRQNRSSDGAFDVVASGATYTNEKAKIQETIGAFREAGATWWLEWLDEQRGTFAQMGERVRQGPPK